MERRQQGETASNFVEAGFRDQQIKHLDLSEWRREDYPISR